MQRSARRLRPALVALACVCALALTGVIVSDPRGGYAGAILTGIIQNAPRGFLDGAVPLTGVISQGGVPR